MGKDRGKRRGGKRERGESERLSSWGESRQCMRRAMQERGRGKGGLFEAKVNRDALHG